MPVREVLSFDTGRAFHSAMNDEIDLVEDEMPGIRWASGGRPTKDNPQGEDDRWWRANGPRMVSDWAKWRQSSGWDVWVLPDGSPAIEVEIQPVFGGVTHRMIIDRVMLSPRRKIVVVDLKSGRQMPIGDLQLGFYRAGLLQVFGVRAMGAYWDARKAALSEIKNLEHYTPELLDAYAARFLAARRAQVFLPNVNPFCKGCGMAPYCAAVGGVQSHLDPDSKLMKGQK